MVICKIGTGAATATVGDTIVVPCTQTSPSSGNNPMPGIGATGHYSSGKTDLELTAVTNSNANGLAILAGSDADLGTMTHISSGDSDTSTLFIADTIKLATSAS
jgi:hypothetical protein